ncbi:MAG: hypothetical protein JXB35_15915 [Anaerolineae bacterium]|nr:hypothetical protein [Anaerolineae bacterium]
MTNHIKIVGWLYIIFGVLGFIGAITLFALLAGSGWISGDAEAARITTIVGIVLGAFFGVLSLPSFAGGLGLLKNKGWARVLIIIIGALNLAAFPVGTILGAYTLWGLLNDDSNRRFAGY